MCWVLDVHNQQGVPMFWCHYNVDGLAQPASLLWFTIFTRKATVVLYYFLFNSALLVKQQKCDIYENGACIIFGLK